MLQLADHPQSIGKVLDDGFKLFVQTLLQILPLSFLAVAMPLAVVIASIGGNNYLLLSSGQFDPATSDITSLVITFAVSVVVGLILAMASYAAIYYKMVGAVRGNTISHAVALLAGVKALIPLAVATLLYALATVLGLMLLVVPGFILMISMMLYMPAYVMDRESIVGSLSRSHKLVWGNWWRSFLIMSIPTVIMIVLLMGLGAISGALIAVSAPSEQGVAGMSQYSLLIEVAQHLLNILFIPMYAAFMIILYNDLKLRKEGGDLSGKIASAAARPS